MKKVFVCLLCLIAVLLLTACHVDKDPWLTAPPTQEAAVTPMPDSEEASDGAASVTPTPFIPAETPVPDQPAPSEGTNLNG